MTPLDREQLRSLLNEAARRLTGEWLLVGGALVALWVESRRTTEDVDLVGLRGTNDERFALMELAGDLGLPVEAVNSAADFFIRRIPGWRDQLEPFIASESCTIYRPTPTLFVLLKIDRLTSQDLDDCLAVIAKAHAERLSLDTNRIRRALDALPAPGSDEAAARRERLANAL